MTEEIKEYIDRFEQLSDINVFEDTKRRDVSEARYLLWYALNKHKGLSDTRISSICEERGLDRNRSSINVAFSRAENIINQSKVLKNIYMLLEPDYFSEEIMQKQREEAILNSDMDALDKLVKNIPANRRKEVYDRVKLQIQSWSWR